MRLVAPALPALDLTVRLFRPVVADRDDQPDLPTLFAYRIGWEVAAGPQPVAGGSLNTFVELGAEADRVAWYGLRWACDWLRQARFPVRSLHVEHFDAGLAVRLADAARGLSVPGLRDGAAVVRLAARLGCPLTVSVAGCERLLRPQLVWTPDGDGDGPAGPGRAA